MQTDRRTEGHDEIIVASRNFADVPNESICVCTHPVNKNNFFGL
jgi:hypothetical protein